MKCLFVISSSQIGGAEKQFIKTIRHLKPYYEFEILILGKSGPMMEKYNQLGVRTSISKGNLLSDLIVTFKTLSRFRPNVLVSWLYRADLISGFVGKLFSNTSIVISGRNTSWPRISYIKLFMLRLNSTYNADKVVVNSNRAYDFHKQIGYPVDKLNIIRNFMPEVSLCNSPSTKYLFGIASRPVPGKGIDLAIETIKVLRSKGYKCELSIATTEISQLNSLIGYDVSKFDFIHLKCGSDDLANWYQEIDLYLGLSSSWESDSNAVLEAIANQRIVVVSSLSKIEDCHDGIFVIEKLDLAEVANLVEQIILKVHSGSYVETGLAYKSLLIERDPNKLTSHWMNVIEGKNEK